MAHLPKVFIPVTAAFLIVLGGIVTWHWQVEEDSAPLSLGQDMLASEVSQAQREYSRLQQQTDPAIAPLSQWPQDRVEEELAREMQISVTNLRAFLQTGLTNSDALIQGQSLLVSGKLKEAQAKFDQVLQNKTAPAQRLQQALEGKAQIAFEQARYGEVLHYRDKAAALVDKTAAPLAWAYAQEEIAFIQVRLARYQDAELLMREAIHLRVQHQGPDHPAFGTAVSNLAFLLQTTNRLAEAEPLLQRALKIFEATYGPDHPNVAIRLNALAQLLKQSNRLEEAEPLSKRAVGVLFRFHAQTGHGYPPSLLFPSNYLRLAREMGVSDGEIKGRLDTLRREVGLDPAAFEEIWAEVVAANPK